MATTSPLINQSLRRHVGPLLRDAGFQAINARNGWRWEDKVICVFNIRAVGGYFSKSTGWPPGSVGVWLGVFYTFFPFPQSVKKDKQGRLLPAEYKCQMRSHLNCGLDQSQQVQSLRNPAERRRTDIWWMNSDGENAEAVARDIADSLAKDGLQWFSRRSALHTALALAEAERDCFNKFAKAAFLAREIGNTILWRKYDSLAETEARRIGHRLDRSTWHVSA